jgi:hypothetical protein
MEQQNQPLQQPQVQEQQAPPVQNQSMAIEIPYDIIPLPSKGLLYPGRKPNIEVEYLTAMDENILTSPNLLQSGKFVDVLLKRKIRPGQIKMDELLAGDRNAIIIWLRATGYGEKYPVTIETPEGEEFETEVDLTKLKQKEIGATPDENGLFDFTLPQSKKKIKFKLLTAKDEDELQKREDAQRKRKAEFSDSLTHKLGTHIMSIDGRTDKEWIHNFVRVMPARDSLEFRKYINKIEPGVDLSITVEGPGGDPVDTFLVLGPDFFWPDYGL